MADSVDRVFGHALNTVNKIRPGSQKPPAEDRLALYGLYKQAMEGDVAAIADRPSSLSQIPQSSSSNNANGSDALRREQEKYDAWKRNEGLSRTHAKRLYIEKLIQTMHTYASETDEARELVEELEFVWDQIRDNSQPHSSNSERSSPLREMRGSGYYSQGNNGGSSGHGTLGIGSSTAALERSRSGNGGERDRERNGEGLRVLSPVSQVDEDELREEEAEQEAEEFVDAPVSQVDMDERFGDDAEEEEAVEAGDASYAVVPRPRPPVHQNEARWRRRVEKSLIKLTTEVAALREQLESRRFFGRQQRNSIWGWMLRLSWWAVQLVVADAVLLWVVILYMRRKKDNRLELAVRVLLGDAVATVQKVGSQVSHQIPRIGKNMKAT